MAARRTDQIWLGGGMVAIVVLVLASWLLLISPKFAEADEVQTQADDTAIQVTRLKKEGAALVAQEKKKTTYQTALDDKKRALPSHYDIPAFLRALQDSGTKVDVEIGGLTVGAPTASDAVQSSVELPLSVSAEGSVDNLSKFLVRLQNVQDRAVLLTSVSLSMPVDTDTTTATTPAPGADTEATDRNATLNITMTAFCTTAGATGTDACKL